MTAGRQASLILALILLVLWSLGLIGSARPGLVEVSGRVTLDGQPLEGALVSLKPTDASSADGRPAHAMTDAEGNFRPRAYADAAGVPKGHYKVAVRKQEIPSNLNLESPSSSPAKFRWLTPRHYSDPESSGLEVQVTAGGMSPTEIALESIGPIETEDTRSPFNYDDP